LNRMNRLGRATFWFCLQIAVIAIIVSWAQTPEMQTSGGDNPQAVGVFALIMAAAVTALVMILRDSVRFVWRRLVGTPLSEPYQADDGPRRIETSVRLRQSRELPPGRGVRKEIR
jgi:hypothetical protein